MMEDRYVSIEQSLIDSCSEVKAMREGKREEHTWDELADYIDHLVAFEQGDTYGSHLDYTVSAGY